MLGQMTTTMMRKTRTMRPVTLMLMMMTLGRISQVMKAARTTRRTMTLRPTVLLKRKGEAMMMMRRRMMTKRMMMRRTKMTRMKRRRKTRTSPRPRRRNDLSGLACCIRSVPVSLSACLDDD